jgi:hypothetical protein
VVLKNGKEISILPDTVTHATAVQWIGHIHKMMESPRKYPLPQLVAAPIIAPAPAAAAAALVPAPVPFVFADVAKVPGGPPAYESVV